jgi:hypothetical protein
MFRFGIISETVNTSDIWCYRRASVHTGQRNTEKRRLHPFSLPDSKPQSECLSRTRPHDNVMTRPLLVSWLKGTLSQSW